MRLPALKHLLGAVQSLARAQRIRVLGSSALLAKHPPEAVAVYLNAFNDMNEAHWANLKTLLESDTRLQLGAHA